MVIIFGYIFLCTIVTSLRQYSRKSRLFLLFLVGTLLVGYRSVSFTADNQAYAEYYVRNSLLTLSESWDRVVQNVGKDPFYYFVGNVFSKIGITYRGWFLFIAAVYLGGFYYCTYRHSNDDLLSILFMIFLSYFYFSMTGLRQALAMGLLFFAFDFAYRKRILPFATFVVLAGLFHSSALIFAVFYLLCRWKIGFKQVLIVVIGGLMAIFSPGYIRILVSEYAWNDALAGYAKVSTGLTWFGYIVQAAILIFCVIACAGRVNKEGKLIGYFNAMAIGLFFQGFASSIDNIFRMSLYFGIYGAYALPMAIQTQEVRNQRIIKLVIIAIMLLYFLRAGHFRYFTLFGGL